MNIALMILTKAAKNLVGMLVGKRMIFWALELAVKQTDNEIDDNAVGLVKAAYENDTGGVRRHAEQILEAYRAERDSDDR